MWNLIEQFISYFVSLFLLKWVLRNQSNLLLLGTKMDTAMDISIQPWIKTQGLDFPSGLWVWFCAGAVPGGDIFWAPLESQEKSWVAFIKNDWKIKNFKLTKFYIIIISLFVVSIVGIWKETFEKQTGVIMLLKN